ncbi:MAG: Uncharacterized protein AWU55_2798 [Halomonadaceae bacterium T82-2]|nr:MAG: Uncharacterized protein AWU55_2798 [Halomonadaceae bacterium T82-2]
MSWLRRLAGEAPVPVFPVLGVGEHAALHRLALTPGVELVDSPRHASVMLVAGRVPASLHDELRRVHDQHPWPFATLWYRSRPLPGLEGAMQSDDLEGLAVDLRRLHRELMDGRRDSSPRLLPDVPPNPWEGLGDDGHGGEGMMGGVPYGRPMAMNMQDDLRDGLTLDSLTFRLGPFFPAFPAGLGAEITLQGDVIQTWTTQNAPYPVALDAVFREARERPVPIARLELARARYHLQRLYHGLRLAGLERTALQALRLASEMTPERMQQEARAKAVEHALQGLRRRLVRCGFFTLAALDEGCLSAEQACQIGGPAARASGIEEDLRSEDTEYRRLGFAPICHSGGDSRARWQQYLAEIAQSLQLACQAVSDNRYTHESGAVETPRGAWRDRRPADVSTLLDDLLPGLEWDTALASLASLDLAGVAEWPPGADEASASRPDAETERSR